ncbi:MAG: ATP-dependent DNA helicase RecG [Synergistetes bacterium]|nr:MAG: ATP-dependent DNA helicase RecG [bacterium 42_11]MBC7332207.1 ATP-dependent DNA helicase RecG [Synergistota bacterium]MDK2871221.1 ATP-dependent helicase RecG [bacterium]
MKFLELLDREIRYLKGIGPKRASDFEKLGVVTLEDLLYLLPRRYEDKREVRSLTELVFGDFNLIKAKVVNVEEVNVRRNLKIIRALISDGSRRKAYAVWYNKGYIKKFLSLGREFLFYGKVISKYGEIQVQDPEFEPVEDLDALGAGRILPVYPLAGNLTQKVLRSVVGMVLDMILPELPDIVPRDVLERNSLMDLPSALREVHFPSSLKEVSKARDRLAFDELFLLQLFLALRVRERKTVEAPVLRPRGDLLREFWNRLSFTLTNAQKRAWKEIQADLSSGKPMNRLLQGDVGSGKTIIAIAAMLLAVENGYQAALMAPTEVLAEQHFWVLDQYLTPLGVKIGLLIGSLKDRVKRRVVEEIASGDIKVVVGTHALIQEGVEFKNLALVVIDEQHRFGVMQRAALLKKGDSPHVLVMTATPIPRTLSLTIYGDLDVSIMDEMPPGRKPVMTYWVTSKKREKVYEFVKKRVSLGEQAYIICPLIEESEVLEAEAATKLFEELNATFFKEERVGLLHGRMKSEEKEMVMKAFKRGDLQILVSTPVIEVGIDVPNATVMVIESADRFGLSQIHQLRGRVGRGPKQSYCILLADPKTEEAKKRLSVVVSTTDGFKIAEEDLKMRGPGELCGVRQHGVTDFKVADILRDYKLLALARKEAFFLVEKSPNLKDYPLLRLMVKRKFAEVGELIDVS